MNTILVGFHFSQDCFYELFVVVVTVFILVRTTFTNFFGAVRTRTFFFFRFEPTIMNIFGAVRTITFFFFWYELAFTNYLYNHFVRTIWLRMFIRTFIIVAHLYIFIVNFRKNCSDVVNRTSYLWSSFLPLYQKW